MEAVLTLEIGEAYRKERGRLLAYIRSRVENLEDAEDILHDVFYHTLQGISVTQPIENLIGWLYTAARNKIIDWYRKKRPIRVSLQENEEGLLLGDLLADSGLHPEKEFFHKLLADAIADSLDELPEKQRHVFIWQAVEGKTFREISAMTGEPINTLISRKRYAVLFLRKRLSEIRDLLNDVK